MDLASLCLLASESTPVIDVDGTIFIQGGIYIGLVLLLRPLLFKPWLAAQARRSEAIDGASAKAKTLRQDADDLVAEYETGLDAARDKALDERADRRREVEAEQAASLAKTRAESLETLEQAREKSANDAQAAREGLAGQVGDLADDIAAKLLGRAS